MKGYYDPNKTVVLVSHGLMDTPATWAPMINALRGDERVRPSGEIKLKRFLRLHSAQ